MAVAIAPSTEAMSAITDRINGGTAYNLEVEAAYHESLVDELEDVNELRVDVVHETEEQLEETLEREDQTSHVIRVWFREKLPRDSADRIAALKLFVRQVFQRLNNYDDSAERVQIYESDNDPKAIPDKGLLKNNGLFVAWLAFRVEVRPS